MAVESKCPNLAQIMEPQIVSEYLRICIAESSPLCFSLPKPREQSLVTKFLSRSRKPNSIQYLHYIIHGRETEYALVRIS